MSERSLELDQVFELLGRGELEVLGRMPWSSNATYLARVSGAEGDGLVIYKPAAGERPLWDFARGTLCRREAAAYKVSEALGWGLVPPTLLRSGPLGDGMVQLFIDHDPEEHYFTLRDAHAPYFRLLAAFDVVVNNADRKGGHCLLAKDGRIWSIDHGVTFHDEDKLRTVIWDYAGQALPGGVLGDLDRLERALEGRFGRRLAALLSRREVEALVGRVRGLRTAGALPETAPGHPYPWPLV